jgi:DNA-directed RNA polymerase specialized sigma24 family protein
MTNEPLQSKRQIDPRLAPLFRTKDSEQQKLLTEQLIATQAQTVINRVLRRKLSIAGGTAMQDESDVYGEVVVRLLKRLQKWFLDPDQIDVANFDSYVAVITKNCCNEYFRKKFPRRWHLRNRVRYVLTRLPSFAMWISSKGDWLCGLSGWEGRLEEPENQRLQKLSEEPERILKTKPVKLPEAIQAIIQYAGVPIPLEVVISILAKLPGIREQFQDSRVEEQQVERLPDPRPHVKPASGQTKFLERLWLEIAQLPPKQRVALLLNLRDKEDREAITIFPASGIASIADISSVVDIPLEEFADLWNELPLDDMRIAERLKLTRQQVINLRKSARERLTFRMRHF